MKTQNSVLHQKGPCGELFSEVSFLNLLNFQHASSEKRKLACTGP